MIKLLNNPINRYLNNYLQLKTTGITQRKHLCYTHLAGGAQAAEQERRGVGGVNPLPLITYYLGPVRA